MNGDHPMTENDITTWQVELVREALEHPSRTNEGARTALDALVKSGQICEAEHWDRANVEALIAERDSLIERLRVAEEHETTAKVSAAVVMETQRERDVARKRAGERFAEGQRYRAERDAALEKLRVAEEERDGLKQQLDEAWNHAKRLHRRIEQNTDLGSLRGEVRKAKEQATKQRHRAEQAEAIVNSRVT